MTAVRISAVVFTDPDTVREVIHNFNRDGFDALYPRYRGGRPRQFTLPQRLRIKQIALGLPTDLGQPFRDPGHQTSLLGHARPGQEERRGGEAPSAHFDDSISSWTALVRPAA